MKKHEEAIKELCSVFHVREQQVGEYTRTGARAEAAKCRERVKNLRATLVQLMEEEKRSAE